MCSTGGPIAQLEHAGVSVFGEPCVHAATYLKEGIVDSQSLELRVTDKLEGLVFHASAQVAFYLEISDAMERWAVHY